MIAHNATITATETRQSASRRRYRSAVSPLWLWIAGASEPGAVPDFGREEIMIRYSSFTCLLWMRRRCCDSSGVGQYQHAAKHETGGKPSPAIDIFFKEELRDQADARSEERRVGKERRS